MKGPRMRGVYVASDANGLHKIGASAHLGQRIRDLRHERGGLSVRLIAVFPRPHDAVAVEHMAHGIIADRRAFGEWFAVGAQEAIDAVQRAAAFHDKRIKP